MSNTGTARSRRSLASSCASSASNVLSMSPDESFTAATARASSSHISSWPSLPMCIRSRTRYGGSSLTGMSSCDSATKPCSLCRRGVGRRGSWQSRRRCRCGARGWARRAAWPPRPCAGGARRRRGTRQRPWNTRPGRRRGGPGTRPRTRR
ncbi:Os03g0824650 [Oryza sativa Japonica Group]|uniref:Os03g0824650 protein n=1 Tax=Oryza sativa subsp. japonica TaxID=39947 RepID=A0A0P0W505_ORYSJ|nr:hypothetical protein EE612_021393 [Oryza sativa]BAS87139.1 Os03g0824650 [Oryza sativa Japonica Group]